MPGRIAEVQRHEGREIPDDETPGARTQRKASAHDHYKTEDQAQEGQEPDAEAERLAAAHGEKPRSRRALMRKETHAGEKGESDEPRAYRARVPVAGRLVLRHWRPPMLRWLRRRTLDGCCYTSTSIGRIIGCRCVRSNRYRPTASRIADLTAAHSVVPRSRQRATASTIRFLL